MGEAGGAGGGSTTSSAGVRDVFDDTLVEKTIGNYRLGKVGSIVDERLRETTLSYKNSILRKLIPISYEALMEQAFGKNTIVMLKRDGEFNVLDYDRNRRVKSVFCNAPLFRGRHGLPVNHTIERILEDPRMREKLAWIKSRHPELDIGNVVERIVLAGELWADVKKENDRSRVFDFILASKQPAEYKDLERIAYDVFDIISINDVELLDMPYIDRLEMVLKLFPAAGYNVQPIPFKVIHEKKEIEELYNKWVIEGHEEGIVVRGHASFKVKPVKDVDVAIIGFSEMLDHEGMVGSVLVALVNDAGQFQVLGGVGSGFSFEERAGLYTTLDAMRVESDYIHTTRDGRGIQMVRPVKIIQVEYMDAIFEDAKGKPIMKALLEFDGSRYDVKSMEPFISLISPRFKRFRDDKKIDPGDLRFDQLGPVIENLELAVDKRPLAVEKQPSTLLFSAVFAGTYRGFMTVQKFFFWKTNKTGNFPAYMVVHESYNHGRKEPLQLSVLPFNDKRQAMAELDALFFARNGIVSDKTGRLKRGWRLARKNVAEEVRDNLETFQFFPYLKGN